MARKDQPIAFNWCEAVRLGVGLYSPSTFNAINENLIHQHKCDMNYIRLCLSHCRCTEIVLLVNTYVVAKLVSM